MQESEAVSMTTDRCKINQMAHVIMEGLQEYADLATEDMKAAVKKAVMYRQEHLLIQEDIRRAGLLRLRRKMPTLWK